MIKAIIFDFYGVIRSDEYHDWLTRHGIKRGGELDNLSKDLDMGITSIDDFFESLSQLSKIPASDIKQEFLAQGSLNEKLLKIIIDLKKKYKVALLTNANSSYLRALLDETGIGSIFDEVIISSEVGFIKPSKEVFKHTLNKLKIKPAEAIFIDDNPSFCQSAEAIGIKSICFQGVNALISNLKEIGIIYN